MTDPRYVALLGKLRKARRLAESARWALLDVKILLDDVEAGLAPESNGHGIVGEDEDSRPSDGPER